MSGMLTNQAISSGAFITLLVQGLGVVTDDLTVVGRNIGMTFQSLKNIKVVGVDRHLHFLLAKSGREWTEGGPDDGEDFGVDEFTFSETLEAIRDMLASRPQAGLSHTPLSTYHQSPPHHDSLHSQTYEEGPSHQHEEPYHPPRSYYDDLTSRMSRIEVNETDLWDYTHRQTEIQDQH